MTILGLVSGIISVIAVALFWALPGGALFIPIAFIFGILGLILGIKTRKISNQGKAAFILSIIGLALCVAEATYVLIMLKRIGEALSQI